MALIVIDWWWFILATLRELYKGNLKSFMPQYCYIVIPSLEQNGFYVDVKQWKKVKNRPVYEGTLTFWNDGEVLSSSFRTKKKTKSELNQAIMKVFRELESNGLI